MKLFDIVKIVSLMAALTANVACDNCKISWIETGRELVESSYVLDLSISNTTGDLRTYFPNTNYDITIKSKHRNKTFTQFYFAIWNVNKTKSYGSLELREPDLSMFHNGLYCINRIIDGPVSLAKVSLKIGWQSPPMDSGCVELRAVIKETALRYHVVNKTVCQDPRVLMDHAGDVLPNCCACDEGKYEVVFEGLWSRYTHPKNFPRREWIAVFPTIIGVSHSPSYNFWQNYTLASEGLKAFALSGDSSLLELEIKNHSISTLIKFRGANFQNKTRKSYAALRVTRTKHVVSLVAKIDPSPDWFVGARSLELCKPDCTWLESKVYNLYAFDAGVRNGMLYEDLEGYTDPQEVIQRLNMTWPPPRDDGLESPFYDPTNNTHDVRPLARIHLKRVRGSERSCQQVELIEDCVTEWSSWGPCSVDCGLGISKKFRSIIEPYTEENCTLPLEDSRTCQASTSKCPQDVTKEDCAVTEWGEWTKCSQMCGQETTKRSRSFVWRDHQQLCEDKFGPVQLEEKMDCGNPPCPDDSYVCAEARYNNWMEWSPCIRNNDKTYKTRFRTIKEHLKKVPLNATNADIDFGYSNCLYEQTECDVSEENVVTDDETGENVKQFDKYDCSLPMDVGACPNNVTENMHRYYYSEADNACLPFRYSGCGGNANRFNDEQACHVACVIRGRRVDCVMSKWSPWSNCTGCNSFRIRQKIVKVQPLNGGRLCPLKKFERDSCRNDPKLKC